MKTILKSLMMAAFFAGLGSTAYAQKTATAPASATILADLTIELDVTQNAIAFGTLSATTPGDIVLDANGESNANTGTQTNVARFDLGGANTEVTVTYDATVTLTETADGVATMTMTPQVVGAETDAEQETAGLVASATTVTLVDNAFFLWVGGTIPRFVTAQTVGLYTGLFNIEVEYN
ncbi:DUF4402 domain-containing protein [Rhodonellum sp.]|uniref:DUF4402 domain-containing protein n=1 Tax=Rhodonellum sp. TaxID=2231180 RepID=UPI00271B37EF|nr:DUF4402 domain-containing protein [Rhodonellum sp.]MDO9552166.1 DUF4402 domain-containing protein [Rhodonellum sp.]